MNIDKILDKYPSLEGKFIVITGASSGLGLAFCKLVLKKGANVVLGIRNLDKGEKILKELQEEFPLSNITILKLDQASFRSIDEFSLSLKEKFAHIDYFVFNAGVYSSKEDYKTEDNFELTLGTNYLGVYKLYYSLEDYFIVNKTRLLFVTSLTARNAKKASLKESDALKRNKMYAYSKYCLSRFVYELSLKDNGISCILLHPGVTKTNIITSNKTGLKNKLSILKHHLFTLFTFNVNKASLIYLEGLFSSINKPYITPRGIFHVSSYPKANKFPSYIKKEGINEETKRYIKEKLDARSK